MMRAFFKNKRILILGFGKEGISTYYFLRKNFPDTELSIADQNPNNESAITIGQRDAKSMIILGNQYLKNLDEYDIVIKSPGIYLEKQYENIYSQSSIFLKFYGKQTIGITGTKGKSTTSSLIHHILKSSGRKSLLVGNIGLPPFDIVEQICEETIIVFELSSHQLNDIKYSCQVGIFLNIYPEHLDHYPNFESYLKAKANIFKYQDHEGIQIVCEDQESLMNSIKPHINNNLLKLFSIKKSADCYLVHDDLILSENNNSNAFISRDQIRNLLGEHNLLNIMAATLACRSYNLTLDSIRNGILSFKSLEHRLEYVGCYADIHFYNDSIATIPEASIMALKALPDTDTLILGGFDRGLDYKELFDYISKHDLNNIIFTGPAGKRMMEEFNFSKGNRNWIYVEKFELSFNWISKITAKNKICLLSPAAASYNQFNNFEERGLVYKKLASEINPPASNL